MFSWRRQEAAASLTRGLAIKRKNSGTPTYQGERHPNLIHMVKHVAEEPAETLVEVTGGLTRKLAIRRYKRSVPTNDNQERHPDSNIETQDVVAAESAEIINVERQINRMSLNQNAESAAGSSQNVLDGHQLKRFTASQIIDEADQEVLEITRLIRSPTAKRRQISVSQAHELHLDDSIENIEDQLSRKDRHVRRSLSVPRALSPAETETLRNRHRPRSSSTPRTFPNADYPMISQYQMDERRNFRKAYYEFQMLKKARKQEQKEKARREYMRRTTCLKKSPPKRDIRARSLSPERGSCCAW